MKILGIDYGDQRIGLSLADSQSIAVPYKVVANKDFWQELTKIITDEYVELIVVGLPHSLSGQQNQRLSITEEFVKKVKERTNLPVETVDEQFTSKIYTKLGVNKDLDKHAATAILETWLEQKKNE